MANFKILSELCVMVPNENQIIAYIDGEDNLSTEQFYNTIAKQLHFPSDFGANLDAFDEMLNDLSWLVQNEIFIVFRNYDDFLADENDELREILLTILDDAAEEWKSDAGTKSLKILIEPSELGVDDLETIGISYEDEA
ncbi:barstar family protein [Flectobacillus longus]|jgi:RNAse (barnase) inhibitor barstar|uniref:Barstar family protein n=1 Tax=Flectobacillus longus TaxID=2984207 RepID=A0ABT6YHS9_9BACT|nr:barstar family protein [Flectobacillus longus]MDI9863152.1 barstar family protein [Flectobacillus longus]MDI9882517.1 barstar family protein [Flectobacillus longus]